MGQPLAVCGSGMWMGMCCSSLVCCWHGGLSRAEMCVGPGNVGMEKKLADACIFVPRVLLFGCSASVWGRMPWGHPGSPPSLLAGHNGLVAVSTNNRALTFIPGGGTGRRVYRKHWDWGSYRGLGSRDFPGEGMGSPCAGKGCVPPAV